MREIMRKTGGKKTGRVAAGLLCLMMLAVGCGTTTTTATTEPPTTTTVTIPPGQVVKIDETANGSVVRLSPGFLLVVDLKGEPSAGYTWNMELPDLDVLKVLPGPSIEGGSMPGETATFVFSFLALSNGKTELHAKYTGPTGEVTKTFKAIIEVELGRPTTTTTGGSTTTTKPSTTTTAQPTTTTTTAPPTTTTTQPLHPTTTTLLGVIYIDEKSDGKIVYLQESFRLQLTLRFNPSTGDTWKVMPYDESVIGQVGGPKFIAGGGAPGSAGWMVWTFEPKGEGSTKLEVDLMDPSGKKKDNFYCGIVVTTAGQ